MGYVRTARSKGLSPRVVTFRHTVRNALVPILTITGIQLATILGGVIVVEVVFAWPGLGRLVFNAVAARDYPVIQGAVLLIAALFLLINLIVDVLYAVVDPEDPAVMTEPARRRPHTGRARLAGGCCCGNPVTVVSAAVLAVVVVVAVTAQLDRAVRHQRRRRAERAATAPAARTGSAPTNSAATCCRGCWSPCRRRCRSRSSASRSPSWSA